MRLSSLRIRNYRTIEDLTLDFPSYYTAICGRNDAGKSNIIKALRSSLSLPDRTFWMIGSDPVISVKDDFTKWKQKETPPAQRAIQVDLTLRITRDDDEGIFRFLQDYLPLPEPILLDPSGFDLKLGFRRTGEERTEQISLSVGDQLFEVLKSQEVVNRIRSSSAFLFHDSTESFHPFHFNQTAGHLRDMSSVEAEKLKAAKANLDRVMTKLAKRNQEDLSEVLGRLKDKYKIGLSLADAETEELSYTITLGNEDGDVELEKWGSGTQNRTRILMTLFRAKRVREAETSAAKVTPVIVIEEPESYLHPSAQAEFGSTLRDLAEEFKVQVIVTTHSPYLLSIEEPKANMLLERKLVRNRLRQTELHDTGGDKWMEPFSLALGIVGKDLAPWKTALFSEKDAIILVEGDIDKEYFELLRADTHGESRLQFDGLIYPYGGKSSLTQTQLLKFMKSRYSKFIVTFDLDAESEVEGSLKNFGLQKGVDYFAIGRDSPGKKCIEGLLPDSVLQAVHTANGDLVTKLMSGVNSDVKSAKSSLKRKYLEEFKLTMLRNSEDCKSFYSLTKQLNKTLAS